MGRGPDSRAISRASNQSTTLLGPVSPVRRYADVVRHVVHSLTLVGFPGDGSLAAHLARAGWRLSRRTVQRIRRERPLPAPEPVRPPNARTRAVRARHPHHVWMLDVTEIPGLFRLFCFKLAVGFDVFSRDPLTAAVFLAEPDAAAMARLLRSAARRVGPPRHLVTDRGAQFTSEAFGRAVVALGVRHRFGAVGKSGSIALIERFFRTLKETAAVRRQPPLLLDHLVPRLRLTLAYYCWLRPHSALAHETPAEQLTTEPTATVVDSGTSGPPEPQPPPRGRRGERVAVVVPFELRDLGQGIGVRLPNLVRKARPARKDGASPALKRRSDSHCAGTGAAKTHRSQRSLAP